MILFMKTIIFFCASAAIVYISRGPLRNPRSHGFYRFFVFEAILVLFLLNVDYWFFKPFSFYQIVAWLLLIIALFLVLHGVQLLRTIGKPDHDREEPSLIGFEKTTQIVTIGAYRYIRHPLYSSLLFLTWGIFFKNPSWLGFWPAILATLFLTVTAKVEEKENTLFFGDSYRQYIKKTRMFIPFIY